MYIWAGVPRKYLKSKFSFWFFASHSTRVADLKHKLRLEYFHKIPARTSHQKQEMHADWLVISVFSFIAMPAQSIWKKTTDSFRHTTAIQIDLLFESLDSIKQDASTCSYAEFSAWATWKFWLRYLHFFFFQDIHLWHFYGQKLVWRTFSIFNEGNNARISLWYSLVKNII